MTNRLETPAAQQSSGWIAYCRTVHNTDTDIADRCFTALLPSTQKEPLRDAASGR